MRTSRTPTCHPDRPHHAHGLCNTCYCRQDKLWQCVRCLRPDGKHGTSALCRACHKKLRADGLFWCPECKQALPIAERARYSVRCLPCKRLYELHWRHANEQRGYRHPPAGYITVDELARRTHRVRTSVMYHLRNGWIADLVKRRAERWFILDQPSYPEPPLMPRPRPGIKVSAERLAEAVATHGTVKRAAEALGISQWYAIELRQRYGQAPKRKR